jgi:phosphonate transport system substrate-binding protein
MSMPSESPPSISIARVLKVVFPVAVVAAAAYIWSSHLPSAAREEVAASVFPRMLGKPAETVGESIKFVDKDGDMVADPPEDPKDCISPDVLTFSFVAGDEESVAQDKWKELIAAVAQKTGHQVKFVHYSKIEDQLAALKNGELQITGLNTGTVPAAVQHAGFVPLCTFGREDGSWGYTMQFLVPAGSPIKTLADIRGRKITFTQLDSNSGFKAPLVLLMDEFHLMPDRDYQWGFSQSHTDSIKGVAAKELDVAPVASDILARMVEKGEVDPTSIVSIYTSERFPPATIGMAYNLSPELRTAIREALTNYSLKGTGLEGEFGADATKLVPVSYKDDWANTRRIDQVVAQARAGKP